MLQFECAFAPWPKRKVFIRSEQQGSDPRIASCSLQGAYSHLSCHAAEIHQRRNVFLRNPTL